MKVILLFLDITNNKYHPHNLKILMMIWNKVNTDFKI